MLYILDRYVVANSQQLTTLSDLRQPVPFTLVETDLSLASDCSTSPITQTQWRTAYLRGTEYPGNGFVATFSQPGGTVYISYVFPDLILTLLHPGDIISMVFFPKKSVAARFA